MNQFIQSFNAINLVIISLYLYTSYESYDCSYLINLYSLAMCAHVILIVLTCIEIYKLDTLIVMITMLSLVSNGIYLYYLIASFTCSLSKLLQTYLVYIFISLLINSMLLLIFAVKTSNIFLVDENTPLLLNI